MYGYNTAAALEKFLDRMPHQHGPVLSLKRLVATCVLLAVLVSAILIYGVLKMDQLRNAMAGNTPSAINTDNILPQQVNDQACSCDKDTTVKVSWNNGEMIVSGHNLVISTGDQGISIRSNPYIIRESKDSEPQYATTREDGTFEFSKADMSVILQMVKAWYKMEVVLHGPIYQKFTGRISRAEPVSCILKQLEATLNVQFRNESGKLIARPVRKPF